MSRNWFSEEPSPAHRQQVHQAVSKELMNLNAKRPRAWRMSWPVLIGLCSFVALVLGIRIWDRHEAFVSEEDFADLLDENQSLDEELEFAEDIELLEDLEVLEEWTS